MNDRESRMSVQPPDQLENEEMLRIFREIDRSPGSSREICRSPGRSGASPRFRVGRAVERTSLTPYRSFGEHLRRLIKSPMKVKIKRRRVIKGPFRNTPGYARGADGHRLPIGRASRDSCPATGGFRGR